MYLLLTYIVYYILCLLYVYALRFEHLHWVDIAHYKNSLLLLLCVWVHDLHVCEILVMACKLAKFSVATRKLAEFSAAPRKLAIRSP